MHTTLTKEQKKKESMNNRTFCITPTEVKSLIEENCIANTMCTIYTTTTTTTTTIIYIVYFIDCGQTREKVGWIKREAGE